MKKCRKLIPLLAVIIVMLLVTTAYADKADYIEVKSGSTTAKVKFTIEDVLAFEGTASTAENNGFKVKNITATTSEKTGFDPPYRSDENDQIVIIGESVPTNITLIVELESSSPMRNGVYYVTLTYGRTNIYGSYSANRIMVAPIYVGIEAPDESGKDTLSTTKKPEQQKPVEPEVTVTEPEGEGDGSGRVDAMGMLDFSALRSALEEAEKLKVSGRLDEAGQKLLQSAIDAAEEALKSDRQGAIDDAAYELFSVIEALGGPVTDEEQRPQKERSGNGLLLPLILAIVAVLGIAGVLTYLYLKKKKHVGYDGAPIVDYEISDDDEM